MDSQDLDFQVEVTEGFEPVYKDCIVVDPGRISPSKYHESWTMTQKHLPLPPLSLINDNSTSISKLRKNTKIFKDASTKPGTTNRPPIPETSNRPPLADLATVRNIPSTSTTHELIQPHSQPHCCCQEEIKKMHNKLNQLCYLVKDMSNRIVHLNSGRSCSSKQNSEIRDIFPLTTLKQLEELEARCTNRSFREEVINHLTNLVSLGKGLSIAFQKTISDSLALSLNLTGTQKKIPLLKFKWFSTILFDAWKSPFDSMETFQQKIRLELRKSHNRLHNQKLRLK